MRAGRILAALCLLAAGACGGTGAFGLSADDNNPAALAQAFARERRPEVGKPQNSTAKPMAYMVAAGAQRKLIAWDLAAGKAAWTVDAEVTSRVAVGTNLLAHKEGKDRIVARDLADGHKLWSHELAAKQVFLGLAADGGRAFYVVQDDSGKRTWYLVALRGGRELWRAEAPGTLGAPAARGGLVFMPFMTQWLTIIDAATGAQLARIRQADEALNFIRTTSDGVYYGSKGIFLLDEKSVGGTKETATYLTATLPDFVRTFYHFDAFQAVQAGYSAFDRNRVLWRAKKGEGGLAFQDARAIVFTFRFFFGFDAKTGDLAWAHQHPRFDVVSAEHVGPAILYVSQEGELGALDPVSGAQLSMTRVGARILGATFDADGFRPAGEGERVNTPETLASIIYDKDNRFNSQKQFALTVLGTLPGQEVTATLLKVLRDESTPAPIYQKAAEVLVARKDQAALPVLLEALKLTSSFLTGDKPRAVDVLARALGAIGKPEAAPALLAHLDDPETPLAVVRDIALALAACENRDALPALRSYLLFYRADPVFASDIGALSATIDALLILGGPAERELLEYVAAEPRTQPKAAEYARRALSQTGPAKSEASSPK